MADFEIDPDQILQDSSVDLSGEEFSDYDGPLLPEGIGLDFSRLLSAESLRGIAAIVVATLVISTPSTSPRAFALLMAVILLAWGVGGVIDLRTSEERRWWGVARVSLLFALGIGLLLVPEFTGETLGRLVGYALMALGAIAGFRALRDRQNGLSLERLLNAAIYVTVGGALAAAPAQILGLAILGLSIYWFIAGVLTLVTNVRLDDRQIEPSGTWRMFLQWVSTRPNTADDRTQLYAKLFYEGAQGPRRLSRFFILMGFATTIAAWGIVADSTAVVIGAMLVAPLMTPLMGSSLSMVMGWPRRALMSGGVAVGGVAFAIGLSVLFGWAFGPDISIITNSQVSSRIGPTLVDLVIAIAAGGAGAFALSRPDVSDSLPGVAVAIALVPPLAVVGLMIAQTNWGAASGALILFSTNLVAIILVGGVVFVLTGVVPLLRLVQRAGWIRRSLGIVAIFAIAIVGLLGANAENFERQTAGLARAEGLVEAWLADTRLSVDQASYSDGVYSLVLTGPEAPPPIEELASMVEAEFGQSIGLSVDWVPSETFTYEP